MAYGAISIRRDRNDGGLLVYMREGIPAREHDKTKLTQDIKCGIAKIILKNQKKL